MPSVAPTEIPEPVPTPTEPPTFPELPTTAAYFVTAVTLASPDSSTQSLVLRSADTGQTWDVSFPFGADVFFLDTLKGWASGDGVLLETSDGGQSWSSKLEAVPGARPALGPLDFQDRLTGLVLGSIRDDRSTTSILRTEDGGDRWTPVFETEACGVRMDVCITRGGHALALLCDHMLVRSEDGGRSWRDESSSVERAADESFRRIDCAGESDLWVLVGSERETSAWTSSDGPEWRVQALPADPFVTQGLSFVSAETGWAAGREIGGQQGAAVYRTDDGGASWVRQFAQSSDAYRARQDVFFADRLHGIVATDRSGSVGFGPPPSIPVYWTTDDGGETWNRLELTEVLGARALLGRSLAIGLPPEVADPELPPRDPADEVMFLSARQSGVFRSLDGGVAWRPALAAPLGLEIFGVELLDGAVGYAVGDAATVLKTSDAGRSWSSQSGGIPITGARRARLRSVTFADAQHGVIGGEFDVNFANVSVSPVLLYTNDGGRHWQRSTVDDPAFGARFGASPRNVCMTPDGLAFAAHQYSAVFASAGLAECDDPDSCYQRILLVSEDFGASWTSREREARTPDDYVIHDVACVGGRELWTFGGRQEVGNLPAEPLVYRSLDAGATWEIIPIPLPSEMTIGASVASASFLGPDEGWVAAGPYQDSLVVLETLDGGVSWAPKLFLEEPLYSSVELVRLDAARAVVVASESLGVLQQQPLVLRTEDAGASWMGVALPGRGISRSVLDFAVAP